MWGYKPSSVESSFFLEMKNDGLFRFMSDPNSPLIFGTVFNLHRKLGFNMTAEADDKMNNEDDDDDDDDDLDMDVDDVMNMM